MIRRPPLRRSPVLAHRKIPSKTKRMWSCGACFAKNIPALRRCGACGTGRQSKRTSVKARADRMARELCRLLADGKCARCGGPGSDWAHRLGRRHHSVRWSMDNCDFLCRSCHRHFTDKPFDFASWLASRGVDMAALERRAAERWDGDYGFVIGMLAARLTEARRAT